MESLLLDRSLPVDRPPVRTDARDDDPIGRPAGRPDAIRVVKRKRDGRVDALRGAALLMMFIDHIPQNVLSRITLRNLGFADAAEIFVLLAGFASMLAYGRALERDGWAVGLGRLARRIGKLYLFQLGLLLSSIILIRSWGHLHPVSPDYLEPELAHGHRNIWRAAFLLALPANLNILPLYIVLLACFPLIWALSRLGIAAVLVPSGLFWAAVNFNPDLNLPNWLDPDGWYFDPIAWQFLFALGAVMAIVSGRHGGNLPRLRPLVWLAVAYLCFSLLEAFPYAANGLPSLAPFSIPSPNKTPLAPLRLLDVMAIFYLVASADWASRLTETGIGRALALLGRHSLEVFTLGTFADLVAKLGFDYGGNGVGMQVAVNVGGVGAMLGLAAWLDKRKRARASASASVPAGANAA